MEGGFRVYRDTSLIRKRTPVGPYRRPMPESQGGPRGRGGFLWARYPCTCTVWINQLPCKAATGATAYPGLMLHLSLQQCWAHNH